MSNCARSSAVGRTRSGFAELERLRVEHEMTVSRFCRAVGLPERTFYARRVRHQADRQVRGPWPTPARDGIRAVVIETALSYPMWGHRKIAWLCRHLHAVAVADATCLRILREAGLVLPVDYVRERRDLAGARRRAFPEIPTRRNRVWQIDFFELETSGGGTWRSGDVIDLRDQARARLPGVCDPDRSRRGRVDPRRHRAGRGPAGRAAARGPHRPGDRRDHTDLPGLRQRAVL